MCWPASAPATSIVRSSSIMKWATRRSRERFDSPNFTRHPCRKKLQNTASDGFGSNFSGAAFCLLHQLVGFLLPETTVFYISRLLSSSKESLDPLFWVTLCWTGTFYTNNSSKWYVPGHPDQRFVQTYLCEWVGAHTGTIVRMHTPTLHTRKTPNGGGVGITGNKW